MEMQPHYMNGSSQGITTTFYINGDDKFPGKKVLFNLKRNRNFTSCLDHLTESLKPPFGAVRNIFTPEGGHRVGRFQELNPDGKYVAAGRTTFKRFRYTDIEKSPRRRPLRNFLDIPPKNKRYEDVHGKIPQTNTQAVRIFVWPNRECINRPDPVTIQPFQLNNMDAVIKQVDDKLKGKLTGCVTKLCSRDGALIDDPKNLRSFESYVAVQVHDRFRRCTYKDRQMPNFKTSPHLERYGVLPPLTHTPGSKNGKSQWSPDTSGHSSYPNSERSYSQRYRKNQSNRNSREDDILPRRPVAHKRSSERKNHRQVDYDKDDGGMFRSKQSNRHTQGAREVRDTRDTRVDLPIDQVPAEEVKDERIRGKPNSNGNNNRTPPKNKSKDYRDYSSPTDRYDSTPRRTPNRRRSPSPDYRRNSSPRRSPSPKYNSTPYRNSPDRYDNQRDEEHAAVKIQSQFRGYQARKAYRSRRNNKNDDRNDRDDRGMDDSLQREQERAATKIQSHYRGYRTRKDYSQKKAKRARSPGQRSQRSGRRSAGSRRSRRSERDFNEPGGSDREAQAATKIQSHYRGYKTRKSLASRN